MKTMSYSDLMRQDKKYLILKLANCKLHPNAELSRQTTNIRKSINKIKKLGNDIVAGDVYSYFNKRLKNLCIGIFQDHKALWVQLILP